MVIHRIEDTKALLSSIDVLKASIEEKLAERFEPRLRPGETLPDYGLALDLAGRDVQAALDRLVDLDDELFLKTVEREGLQQSREEILKEEVYPRLVNVRGAIDRAYERRGARLIHRMEGRTPRKPTDIEHVVENLLRVLGDPDATMPLRKASAPRDQREEWLRLLAEPHELARSMGKEQKKCEGVIARLGIFRRRAMDDFDQVYAQILRYVKAKLVLTGESTESLRHLRPHYQRRKMARQARQKREARAETRSAAAEPERGKQVREAVRSTVAKWLGKAGEPGDSDD
ncbi:MAG: hypothetical protein GY719_40640 [bacterium]|nr:hypothetical protein [bacterium]